MIKLVKSLEVYAYLNKSKLAFCFVLATENVSSIKEKIYKKFRISKKYPQIVLTGIV